MVVDFDIWDPKLTLKIKKFFRQDNSDVSKVIFNAALEFQYNLLAGDKLLMEELIEYTGKKNILLVIITATHPNYKLLPNYPHLKINYWCTAWITILHSRLENYHTIRKNSSIGMDLYDLETGKNTNINYPFITMNKRPKVHRAIMIDMLAKHNLIDQGVVIWREHATNYKFKYWDEKILLRDQKEEFKVQEYLPDEYPHSFAQLVTESSDSVFILSEKAGMPLFFNKPFLVAGCKHYHAILKEMGFLLYDELFDYGFDSCDDLVERYDLIAQNFARISSTPLEELSVKYNKIFEKCVFNKNLALKLSTSIDLLPPVWNEMVEHKVKNNLSDWTVYINNFINANEQRFKF